MHAVCARAVSVLRAFGADDVTSAPHAYGVDDIAGGIVCPGARPVFRVGHSKRAEVGHFSRAPRLVALDSLISETQKSGTLAKEFINRELISLRGMFSFVEAQLKDIQMLFKSTKQRRRDIRVRDVLEKVHNLFEEIGRAHV